jgi:hypothetical protein
MIGGIAGGLAGLLLLLCLLVGIVVWTRRRHDKRNNLSGIAPVTEPSPYDSIASSTQSMSIAPSPYGVVPRRDDVYEAGDLDHGDSLYESLPVGHSQSHYRTEAFPDHS